MYSYQDSFNLQQRQTMVHCKTSQNSQLRQAKEDAYRKGDKVLYKQAKYTLEKEIRVAMRNYSGKLRNKFSSSDSASVWKGMKYITGYKTPSPSTVETQQMADDLNEFYHRFEITPFTPPATPLSPTPALQIREDDVRSVFKNNKRRKAPGPDGVSPACLKTCADQLAPIFTRSSTDHWSCAKSPHASNAPPSSPSQRNMSQRNIAVNMGLHFILQHLDRPGTYVRILFVDFSSAFNTIIPDTLQNKLTQLSVPTSVCQWITSFLTDREQLVRLGKFSSSTQTISTGAPQGCVLSPLLFCLYTNNCTSKDPSVKLLKFADDTTLIGLIQDGDESAYRE